ncbi:MAG: 3'-5' exoribonuclease [Candidatus Melainabacteria bacterium]|nr:3'-5' exoribonuclease [Candidatus Melainabacteria bacterium]
MLTKNFLLNLEKNINKIYCVTDIETTGQKPEDSEIIEIASVIVQNGQIKNDYCSYIKPLIPIPDFITKMTGIRNEDVKDAFGVEVVLKEWLDFIKDADYFCAHNVMFDHDFIYKYLITYKLPLDNLNNLNFFCTVKTARVLYPELPSRKLNDLIKHFNIPVEKRHRALDDAIATAKILLICFEEIKKKRDELLKLLEARQMDKLKSFEAAEFLSIPKEKVYQMVKDGTLKINETYTTKNGHEGYLFLRRDVEELAQKINN